MTRKEKRDAKNARHRVNEERRAVLRLLRSDGFIAATTARKLQMMRDLANQ